MINYMRARGWKDTGKTTVALTEEIKRFCREEGIKIAGIISYDETVTKALVGGVPLVAYEAGLSSKAAEEIARVWDQIEYLLHVST